ncbi:MAG: hypothetical protein COB15_17465, partial [Flavobacteriales bacterium]
MKKKLLFSLLLIASNFGYSQTFEWAKNTGGMLNCDYEDFPRRALAIDGGGNTYIIGTFFGTVDFDPGPGTYLLTSIGFTPDIFISKLDVNGNFVWTKSFGGNFNGCTNSSITIDNSGNVYSTGYFNGTVDFDPNVGTYNLTALGGDDIFISKLDANGNFLWAKSIGGSNSDDGRSIVADNSGNVYTTGKFQGTVDFDPNAGTYNLTALGGNDIFISKLDANGNFVWAKSIGGSNWDESYSISIDNSGNIYTTGKFLGTVDFDPNAGTYNLTALGSSDIFISKLDANGNFVWAKNIGGSNSDGGHSIVADNSGNVYTTGKFYGTVDFDPNAGTYNLTALGGNDIFISKLDTNGNFIWAKNIGPASNNNYSIAVDISGNIYSTGEFINTFDFDPNAGTYNLTSSGGYDIFISKLDANGNFVWAKNIGGSNSEESYSIAIDNLENIYTCGNFSNTVDFDPDTGTFNLTSIDSLDIFIHKINQCNTSGIISTITCNSYTSPSGNYTWTATGNYTDTIPNAIGCDSIITINLTIIPSGIANYTFTDNGNGNYSFINTSIGIFNQSHWAFGDGNTSTIISTNHTFSANGTFAVVLTINDSTTTNSCVDFYLDTIIVTTVPSPVVCASGFVMHPDTTSNDVTIVNSSTGNNLTYLWNFGDGSPTSSLQNPTHTYTTSGPFYLCLTVDDGAGCVDMYCDSIGENGVVFKTGGFTINVIGTPIITGLDNNLELNSDINIYPNPTSNQLTIDTELKL